MQKIAELMQAKAVELLQSGKAERVLAWQAGEFFYDNAPAAFNDAEACKNIVYNEFCPANLAKYLIEATKQQKKTVDEWDSLVPLSASSISELPDFLSDGPVSHVFELRTKSWTLCQE